MDADFLTTAMLFACVFVFAGTIKGLVGIGLPTASVGVMAQFADPKLAIAVVVIPIVLINGWQAYRQGGFGQTWLRYRLLILMMIPTLFLTTFVTAGIDGSALILWLGFVVVLFSLNSLLFTPPPLPDRFDRYGQIGGGFASGVLGGLTSIWAPPVIIYLLARRVEKEDFVRASGVILFCGSVPLLAGYWTNDLLAGNIFWMSLAMVPPALLGFWFGELMRRSMDADRFRNVVLIIFLVMGLNLLRRALF